MALYNPRDLSITRFSAPEKKSLPGLTGFAACTRYPHSAIPAMTLPMPQVTRARERKSTLSAVSRLGW
jgi:hypothetical protein